MPIYTKPMTKEDKDKWLEMLGYPTKENIKEIQEIIKKDKQKALDKACSDILAKKEDEDIDGAIAEIRRAAEQVIRDI